MAHRFRYPFVRTIYGIPGHPPAVTHRIRFKRWFIQRINSRCKWLRINRKGLPLRRWIGPLTVRPPRYHHILDE